MARGQCSWVLVGKLTIRARTALQMGEVWRLRREAHAGFVAAATGAVVDDNVNRMCAHLFMMMMMMFKPHP